MNANELRQLIENGLCDDTVATLDAMAEALRIMAEVADDLDESGDGIVSTRALRAAHRLDLLSTAVARADDAPAPLRHFKVNVRTSFDVGEHTIEGDGVPIYRHVATEALARAQAAALLQPGEEIVSVEII